MRIFHILSQSPSEEHDTSDLNFVPKMRARRYKIQSHYYDTF